MKREGEGALSPESAMSGVIAEIEKAKPYRGGTRMSADQE
jgi:hypothetical protein